MGCSSSFFFTTQYSTLAFNLLECQFVLCSTVDVNTNGYVLRIVTRIRVWYICPITVRFPNAHQNKTVWHSKDKTTGSRCKKGKIQTSQYQTRLFAMDPERSQQRDVLYLKKARERERGPPLAAPICSGSIVYRKGLFNLYKQCRAVGLLNYYFQASTNIFKVQLIQEIRSILPYRKEHANIII